MAEAKPKEKIDLQSSLAEIQHKLKAPKNQLNKFGGYNYRSLEDIMEAVKPLLVEYGGLLIVSDDIVQFGDRYYIKATATYTDGQENISTTAYAREPLVKKGMDESQITGAASSYARKYAMNGLLAIDDTKDADSINEHKEEPAPKQSAKKEPQTPKTDRKEPEAPKVDKVYTQEAFKKFIETHEARRAKEFHDCSFDFDTFKEVVVQRFGREPGKPESIGKIIKEIRIDQGLIKVQK